jgi:hypothetical protein
VAERKGRARAEYDRVILRMGEGNERAQERRQRLEALGFEEYRRGPTTWFTDGYGRDHFYRRRRGRRPVASRRV